MSTLDGRRSDGAEEVPVIKEFEGLGELTVGGSITGGDYSRLLFTALSLLDNPTVNSYLLANHLKLKDRITKTQIFPREGMSLPEGEVYEAPQEVLELPAENMENE